MNFSNKIYLSWRYKHDGKAQAAGEEPLGRIHCRSCLEAKGHWPSGAVWATCVIKTLQFIVQEKIFILLTNKDIFSQNMSAQKCQIISFIFNSKLIRSFLIKFIALYFQSMVIKPIGVPGRCGQINLFPRTSSQLFRLFNI